MRIVGGKYKGRRIHPPRSTLARPTTDYAKEGLFNILQHTVNELPDMFSAISQMLIMGYDNQAGIYFFVQFQH